LEGVLFKKKAMRAEELERPIATKQRITDEMELPRPREALEDGGEQMPKASGADDYVKMLERLDGANDPMLGQAYSGGGAEGEGQVDASQMSTLQKIRDRNWKVKLLAINELTRELGSIPEETLRADYYPSLVEAMASPIPNFQKSVLDLVLKLLEEKNAGRWIDCKELLRVVIDKLMGSLKPLTKKPVQDLVGCAYMSLGRDGFFELMKEYFPSKNHKIRAAFLRLFIDLLAMVGFKEFGPLRYWEQCVKDSENTNVTVKKEFYAFSLEIFRWMGDAFSIKMEALKKTSADEISKLYQEYKANESGPVMPIIEKFRKDYLNRSEEGVAVAKNVSSGEGSDFYDQFEAFDVYKNFQEKWTEKVIAEEKWAEKARLTDEFFDFAKAHPKHTGNCYAVIALAKRLMDDSNINIQAKGAKIISVVSKGLRKELSRDGKKIISILVPRLKERKKLTDEIFESLKNTVYFTLPQESVDEYETHLLQKNQMHKENIMEWLNWYVAQENPSKLGSFVSAFKNVMNKLTEDSALEIRDANMKMIRKLQEKLGSDNIELQTIAEKLPKNKSSSIIGQTPRLSSQCSLSEVTTKPNTNILKERKLGNLAPGSKKMEIEKPKGKEDKTVGGVLQGFAEVRTDLNCDAIVAVLKQRSLFPEEFNQILNATWKVKEAFMTDLSAKLVSQNSSEAEFEAFSGLLALILKSFKESNPNLLKHYLGIIGPIVESHQDKLSPKFVYTLAWFFVEKYGDTKFSEKLKQIVDQLTAKNRGFFMLSLCELLSSKGSSPKTHGSLLSLLGELVNRDRKAAPKKELMVCAKESISNTNAGVRDEGVGLFCVLYSNFGDPVKKYLVDVNPQIKKTIESKFDKITPMEMEHDENLPKKDVSQLMVKILPKLSDARWQVRKEGLTEATKILSGAGKVSTKGLTDFVTAVKSKLSDANVLVSREALTFVVAFSRSLGIDFKNYARSLLTPALMFLTDKFPTVKEATVNLLEWCSNHCGLESVVPLLVNQMKESTNFELVMRIVEYLSSESNVQKIRRTDCKAFGRSLVHCILNKQKDLRKLSEDLFVKTASMMSREGWLELTRDLNPSVRESIENLIRRHTETSSKGMDIETKGSKPPSLAIEEKPTVKVLSNQPIGKASPAVPVVEQTVGALHATLTQAENEFNSNVLITYNAPTEDEVARVMERLSSFFGPQMAEKMMSSEGARTLEAISNVELMKLTQPDHFKSILGLIFNWVYLSVYNSENCSRLDQFMAFLLRTMEFLNERGAVLDEGVFSKIFHILNRTLEINSQREGFGDLVKRLTTVVGKSCFKEEFLGFLVGQLANPAANSELIGMMLAVLVDYVALNRCLSLRALRQLELHTLSLANIMQHEIFLFFTKVFDIYGQSAFDILRFENSKLLGMISELHHSNSDSSGLATVNHVVFLMNQPSRESSLKGMEEFLRILEDLSEEHQLEVKFNSARIGLALVELQKYLIRNLNDEIFSMTLSQLMKKLFSLEPFLLNLNRSTLMVL
jgi:hypothetical protein